MAKSFRAVYRDGQGKTYSCPAVKTEHGWQMVTSDGLTEITHDFHDDIGGALVFSHYREEELPQLHVERGSNWADHKQAFAEQRLAEERKHRDQGRNEIQNVAPDPAKIQQARQINNEFAALKNRHGIKND